MNIKTRLNSMAIAVANLMKEDGQNFYTAFDTVFASSNFPEHEKEWVQKNVGARMNWRRQMKRCRSSKPAPPKSAPLVRTPKAVQGQLRNIHGYPD